jgi:hypothetical protein
MEKFRMNSLWQIQIKEPLGVPDALSPADEIRARKFSAASFALLLWTRAHLPETHPASLGRMSVLR